MWWGEVDEGGDGGSVGKLRNIKEGSMGGIMWRNVVERVKFFMEFNVFIVTYSVGFKVKNFVSFFVVRIIK